MPRLPAAVRRRRNLLFRRGIGLPLLAGAALLSVVGVAFAGNVSWKIGLPTGNFKQANSWQGVVVPGLSDTAIIAAGQASLGRNHDLAGLTLNSGGILQMTVAVGELSAALNVGTVNINAGGMLNFNNAAAAVNVGTALNIATNGTLSGVGTVTVGAGGVVTQNGGNVTVTKLTTPTYALNGGKITGTAVNATTFTQAGTSGMAGKVSTGTYAIAGNSYIAETATIDFSDSFTLSASGNIREGAASPADQGR